MASYDNIKLEKGLYTTGKSFTQALEDLDPSEAYIGTPLEGLDAYQRQLKRFDIKVSGKGSDRVEKFFQNTDSAALFPEYVSRAVAAGMEENDILPQIIATTTQIDGMDYRTVTSLPTEQGTAWAEVNEATAIPETVVAAQGGLVNLKKRGRLLSASYETLRFQRLDLFTVILRKIGHYIANAQLQDALAVLVSGDSNNNAAASAAVASSGTLTYADLVNFWNTFAPFNLNAIVASPSMMAAILKLSELRDAPAGLNFHGSGSMVTPFGASLMKHSAVTADTLVGLDKTCALEMVQSGGVCTEFDKLIDRQIERAAITSIAGFAKIFPGAAKTLSL